MKKIVYLIILIASVGLFGCTERNKPSNSSGYIQVLNNTNDPYMISFKGNTPLSFSINGKHSITKSVSPGYYTIHVEQQTGYYLYPTEKDYEGYVTAGNTLIVSF